MFDKYLRLYVDDNKVRLESGEIATSKMLTTADLQDYLPAGANVDAFKIAVRNRGGKLPLQAIIVSGDADRQRKKARRRRRGEDMRLLLTKN